MKHRGSPVHSGYSDSVSQEPHESDVSQERPSDVCVQPTEKLANGLKMLQIRWGGLVSLLRVRGFAKGPDGPDLLEFDYVVAFDNLNNLNSWRLV